MIELIAAAVTGAVVGGGVVVWGVWPSVTGWKARVRQYDVLVCRTLNTLTALRSNCFIPDERGVKVRYSDASVARRVKAETPKDVV